MRKLLSANFDRMWRSKALWILIAVSLLLSLYGMGGSVRLAEARRNFSLSLEYYFFTVAPYIGLICALFIPFYIGVEHADCTIRNKLIVGHTRKAVYLSNYVVSVVAGLLFDIAWFVGFMPGYFLIGPFSFGWEEFLVYIVMIIGMTASFMAIFTWIGMMSTNKALTVILVLVTWGVLVTVAETTDHLLSISEFIGGQTYIDGKAVWVDLQPNPKYISGLSRKIVTFVRDVLPQGQAVLVATNRIGQPFREVGFSVIVSVLITGLGVFFFRRKDLK